MQDEIKILNAHVELLNFFANISDEEDDTQKSELRAMAQFTEAAMNGMNGNT